MARYGRVARVSENDKSFIKMENIAILNICDWGSTGKIANNLLRKFREKGYSAYFFYGRGTTNTKPFSYKIESDFEVYSHIVMSRITGLQGSFSPFGTRKLIRLLEKLNIDTVFLISIHGYYIDESAFFSYVARKNLKLIYLMIDEYSYLGKCTNDPICSTYIEGKGKCPNIKAYPRSLFFNTCPYIIKKKKRCYESMKNATFVGPEFLVRNAEKSYLGKYMNKVILDEAINLELYKPLETIDLQKNYGINTNKTILLCVAPSNHPHRGAPIFLELAKRFTDDDRFVFIHLGYKEKDTSSLPINYIPISFVESDNIVAQLYSVADLLINPSIHDAMSNTCLESLACGTPIVCFNTSGMPYLMDETVGRLIEIGDMDALVKIVKNTRKKTQDQIDTCRNYALKRYDNRLYVDKLIRIVENGYV